MTNLARIELVKLRTTPALFATAALVMGLCVTAVVYTVIMAGKRGTPALGSVANVERAFSQPAAIGSTAVLILGILAIAGEYRHRTILGTFLAEPRRARVLIAKLLVLGAVGAVLGAITFGLCAAVGVPLYAARGVHHLPVSLATFWVGTALCAACFGLLGVALGAVTRNAVAAIVIGILWTQLIEVTVLRNAAPDVARWLPTGAAMALTTTDRSNQVLPPAVAAVVLVGWALLLTALACVFAVRREVR
jgi:hypothetical protein